jgi:hypothetical protein
LYILLRWVQFHRNNDAVAMLSAAVGSAPYTLATFQNASPMLFQCMYGFGDLIFAGLFLKEYFSAGKARKTKPN